MSNSTKITTFMSKDNMRVIIGIFTKYMEDTQNFVFQSEDLGELKQNIFKFMNITNDKSKSKSIHEKNLEVLSVTKEFYVAKITKHKPNIKNLERETDVYGNRKITVNELIPQRDPYLRKPISELDKFISERDDMFTKTVPDITRLGQQTAEPAENADDFMRKLKDLENDRTMVDQALLQQMQRMDVEKQFRVNNTIDNQDPKKLYTITDEEVFKSESMELLNDSQKPSGNMKKKKSTDRSNDDIDKFINTRQSLLIPSPQSSSSSSAKMLLHKYISINSFDREWNSNVLRYNYSVTFNGEGINGNYKNIRNMEIGKVIIPEEISENVNILNYSNKTQFNYEFSFSYPYLILRIDEFNDVYDGTNDNIRKSFCKLLYHRHYKAPNGRGYVILKPFQKEKKSFYPSPLSSLNRLTISILKPNGFLLNNSADSYKIFKVDYDAFNPHFYTIVTDVFFDKNEFYVGDVVVIKNFTLTSNTYGIQAKNLIDYINRPEGHEITQIGNTNNNGFYRSFYISAIGSFDKVLGKFDVDLNCVECLNEYNNTINYNTFTGTNGSILNYSLQNTIGMSLDVLVNDVSNIEPALV